MGLNFRLIIPVCLSQDDGDAVMVAEVMGVGLDFSIPSPPFGLAKVGLVQNTCKYCMHFGLAILTKSWKKSTSINVRRQGHKLIERLSREV